MRARTSFRLIPAVDVLDDQAVRLVQGDYDEISHRAVDPASLIATFVAAGAELVHAVDLTGARAGRVRPELVRELVTAANGADIQASGGIRTAADADALVAAGAARVVVGTAAFGDDALLRMLVDGLGDRLVVAIDVRDGFVAVRGWKNSTGFTVERAVERCHDAGVPRLLCTAIERDGTLAGPALDLLAEVVSRSQLPVLAAGGVHSLDDVRAIEATGCEAAIVGRALLEGTIPLAALGSG